MANKWLLGNMREENIALVLQAYRDLDYEYLYCHSNQAQALSHQLR
jgi:hypothetical protein